MIPPTIPPALLDYLQGAFPDTLPSSPVSPVELGILIGHQVVIRHLKHQIEVQNRTTLPSTRKHPPHHVSAIST